MQVPDTELIPIQELIKRYQQISAHTNLYHCTLFKPGACRPQRAWFLKIVFVQEVSMRVCVSAPEAMNN